MNTIDYTPKWDALENKMGKENCVYWMYMGTVRTNDNKVDIFLYKNIIDRKYINLSNDGREWVCTVYGYKLKGES